MLPNQNDDTVSNNSLPGAFSNSIDAATKTRGISSQFYADDTGNNDFDAVFGLGATPFGSTTSLISSSSLFLKPDQGTFALRPATTTSFSQHTNASFPTSTSSKNLLSSHPSYLNVPLLDNNVNNNTFGFTPQPTMGNPGYTSNLFPTIENSTQIQKKSVTGNSAFTSTTLDYNLNSLRPTGLNQIFDPTPNNTFTYPQAQDLFGGNNYSNTKFKSMNDLTLDKNFTGTNIFDSFPKTGIANSENSAVLWGLAASTNSNIATLSNNKSNSNEVAATGNTNNVIKVSKKQAVDKEAKENEKKIASATSDNNDDSINLPQTYTSVATLNNDTRLQQINIDINNKSANALIGEQQKLDNNNSPQTPEKRPLSPEEIEKLSKKITSLTRALQKKINYIGPIEVTTSTEKAHSHAQADYFVEKAKAFNRDYLQTYVNKVKTYLRINKRPESDVTVTCIICKSYCEPGKFFCSGNCKKTYASRLSSARRSLGIRCIRGRPPKEKTYLQQEADQMFLLANEEPDSQDQEEITDNTDEDISHEFLNTDNSKPKLKYTVTGEENEIENEQGNESIAIVPKNYRNDVKSFLIKYLKECIAQNIK